MNALDNVDQVVNDRVSDHISLPAFNKVFSFRSTILIEYYEYFSGYT